MLGFAKRTGYEGVAGLGGEQVRVEDTVNDIIVNSRLTQVL